MLFVLAFLAENRLNMISTNISAISMKLNNEMPKNKPKFPPIFEMNASTVIASFCRICVKVSDLNRKYYYLFIVNINIQYCLKVQHIP